VHTTTRIAKALSALALSLPLVAGCATTSPEAKAEQQRKARGHYEMAMNHMREGRTGIAITELENARRLDPKDPWTELALGEAYRLKAHNEKAEQHLKRAIDLRPDFHAARLNLAALYIQMGRFEDAIELTQALLADPTFPVPWKALTNQGYAYYKLGKRAEARTALENAVQYHEGYWPALLDLAILEADEGRQIEALERFERVLAQKPGALASAETHYRMAVAYLSLGNRDKAVHHLSVAIETRPSGEWGKRSADYLKRLR
jgi:type IV pilus biogenesis/stability protein PilW